MILTSPLWLLALLPWAGVCVWVLMNRRRRVPVPFVHLWRGPVVAPRSKQRLTLPPIAIIAVLVATLLAIVSASRPATGGAHAGRALTVVVDRGLTMSAQGETDLRFRESIDALLNLHDVTSASVFVLPAPDAAVTSLRAARDLGATALDTELLVHQLVARLLATTDDAVLVLSDHDFSQVMTGSRAAQLRPDRPVESVGIVHVASRDTPFPQTLLQISNPLTQVTVRVGLNVDGRSLSKEVTLPGPGRTTDVTFDIPDGTMTQEAWVDTNDALLADDRAFLVRQATAIRFEAHSTLPASVQRMIDVYRRARAAPDEQAGEHSTGDDASRGVVVDSLFRLADSVRGVAVLSDAGTAEPIGADAAVVVEDHPLTALVDWRRAASGARASGAPGDGWLSLVSVGDRVLLASRTVPQRQVWVGFVSDEFPRSTDFVILWTRIFDWLGNGREAWTSQTVSSDVVDEKIERRSTSPQGADARWWPGVVESAARGRVALNAPPVPVRQALSQEARQTQLQQVNALLADVRGGLHLAPWLLLGAVLSLIFALFRWPTS